MPFQFLKRQRSITERPRLPVFAVDVHAHVLPGLDNGPATLDESIVLLQEMAAYGVRKVVATPHIMGDFYNNTNEGILFAYQQLKSALASRNINIEVEVAAEYYLDVSLVAKIESQQPLLLIANKYLLFETNIIGIPLFLNEVLQMLNARGIVPVMAHPERYHYLQQDFGIVRQLRDHGVLFQVNIGAWQHSHFATRQLAERLVQEGMVSLMGSNVHNAREWAQASDALRTKTYAKAVEYGLLNQKLF
ncbi:MAG: capsular biosynthesis protein [Spirosomaceae bacterium]|nr:capsular biosynthesis protein [Spirosomataceae bacterium]